MVERQMERLLIIEPFYGGSHKKLIDTLASYLPGHRYRLVTMSGKKWHWRARSSALYVSSQIPRIHRYETLFCTSVLPLAELVGMRPDLQRLRKVVYFHENQLTYPIREQKERDYQYGHNEIMTCLCAEKVLFNSKYNMESFLTNVNNHIRLQPDHKVKDVDGMIRPRCAVIYFPLDLETYDLRLLSLPLVEPDVLVIVWPHRWEHDKNPEAFYDVLCKLDDAGHDFKVNILGETFQDIPDVFRDLKERFGSKIGHCGYVESELEYFRILKNSDVVVSTAVHEFFGVAVMEAVYAGCVPVVPMRLAYKEFFHKKVPEVYNTDEEMFHQLAKLCQMRKDKTFNLKARYKSLIREFDAADWFKKFMEYTMIRLEA